MNFLFLYRSKYISFISLESSISLKIKIWIGINFNTKISYLKILCSIKILNPRFVVMRIYSRFFFFFSENNLYTFTHVSEQIRINKYTKEKENNNNRSKRDETLFLLLLLFHCNYHFFYTKNNKKRTGFIFTTSFCLLLIQMQSYD